MSTSTRIIRPQYTFVSIVNCMVCEREGARGDFESIVLPCEGVGPCFVWCKGSDACEEVVTNSIAATYTADRCTFELLDGATPMVYPRVNVKCDSVQDGDWRFVCARMSLSKGDVVAKVKTVHVYKHIPILELLEENQDLDLVIRVPSFIDLTGTSLVDGRIRVERFDFMKSFLESVRK